METAHSKRDRIQSVLSRTKTQPGSFNTCSTSPIYKERSNPGIKNPASAGSKQDRLAAMLNNAPIRSKEFTRSKPAAEPLKNGWYEVGWQEKKTYSTKELVMYWRILWKQKYPQTPPPSYPFYLKQHLLSWLKADGFKLAEAIFEFAFEHWELLKVRYSIEADAPTLNILYGYRKAVYDEMKREKSRSTRSINTRWKAEHTDESDTADFIPF